MPIVLELQSPVCCIHDQKERHQHDLENKYVVGIAFWPAIEFVHGEPWYPHHIPPDQKHNAGSKHQEGQYFKEINNEAIGVSKIRRKETVRTKDAIQHDLEDLDIDNDEPSINRQVEESNKGFVKHAFLTK